jgi:hypothetical protein
MRTMSSAALNQPTLKKINIARMLSGISYILFINDDEGTPIETVTVMS